MIITAKLTDGKTEAKACIEIEQDNVSISFGNTSGINIIFNGGRITAFIYTQEISDPEVINLTTTI